MGANMKTDRLKLKLILAAGFFLRLFYVLYSTIYDRQYDIGMIDLDAGRTVTGGHLAYIQYLYENWHLPDFDPTSVYQFNHPPLHHYISALWLKICSFFIQDTAMLEEMIQAVPFVCSLVILVLFLKIFRQLHLKEKTLQFLMLLFSFHPALVLLSGSVNNDCMSLMFTLLCVYTTVNWSRTPTARNIVKIALSIALGMLTKLNVAEMAFPIAFVFVYVLFKKWRENAKRAAAADGLQSRENVPRPFAKKVFPGSLFGQFALFGIVSVPLGMSFGLRNLILYRVPLLWVYTLPEDSWQYTGNVPLINRFLWPVPSELLDNLLHFKIGCGYNVWMQIIRTSVLGEWDMAGVGRSVKALAVLLMFAGAVLALAALAAFILVFFLDKKKKRVSASGDRACEHKYEIDMPCRILFISGYLVNLLFYLSFAFRYPQQCSMHFRYIEIELLFPAAALGFVLEKMEKRGLKRGLYILLFAFCVLSTAMIGYWCLA